MIISAIYGVSDNGVIGKGNVIPWHLSADLKYFKKITMGHPVIMGRKSYLSIGKPLPGRTNIILTRNENFKADGCIVVHTIESALDFAQKNKAQEVFIIGGGEIYRQSMPYWDKIYITEIEVEVEGDVFAPKVDWKKWQLVSAEYHTMDKKNPMNYTFKVYARR